LSKTCASDKGIIISCTRCSCINEDLKDYLVKGKDANNITIYGDSNCVRKILLTHANHIKQSTIDSIYESNYNLMLYKKRGSSVKFKLIKTEESENLVKIADSFFE
jgi:ribonuclease HI